MTRLTVHFAGRVQGVGFRFTTTNIARGHDVTGYVQNLPDHTVRLVAEGDSAAVRAFINEVKQTMADYIKTADETKSAATGEFDHFGVKY